MDIAPRFRAEFRQDRQIDSVLLVLFGELRRVLHQMAGSIRQLETAPEP